MEERARRLLNLPLSEELRITHGEDLDLDYVENRHPIPQSRLFS